MYKYTFQGQQACIGVCVVIQPKSLIKRSNAVYVLVAHVPAKPHQELKKLDVLNSTSAALLPRDLNGAPSNPFFFIY